MRIVLRLATFITVLVAVLVGTARAQMSVVASYNFGPPNSLVTGTSVKYGLTITNQSGPVSSYRWQWAENDTSTGGNACNSLWKSFTNYNQSSITVFEPWPGTYNVKCTVTFGPGSGGVTPPPVDSNTLIVTVLNPDGFTITSGLNTPVDINTTISVIYTITCGGVTSLGNVGTAQELITNKSSMGTPLPDDTTWVPASASANFYLNGNFIVDLKGTHAPAQSWNTIPVGSVFFKFTQNNRIIMTDTCNNTNTYSLGSVNLQRRKVSTTQWQVEKQ